MITRAHTDKEYEAELTRLKERILIMGAKVEEMIDESIKALIRRDSAIAHNVIARDKQINSLEIENDELCLIILAKRQPVASDLRFVTIALKFVTDLERIGDLAVNIGERVLELNQEEPMESGLLATISQIAEITQSMLKEALDAFVSGDAERSSLILKQDEAVDSQYEALFQTLLQSMMANPQLIYRATRLQSVGKYLERIADHATNLSEMVVFMSKGQDIRHSLSRISSSAQTFGEKEGK